MTSSPTIETAGPGADTAEVAAVPGKIVAAWAAYDAAAFADVFTADGSMILPGSFAQGRDNIRAFMSAAFAGPYAGTRVTGSPIDLRFLSADVAIITTIGGVKAPGETEVADERAVRATWVVTRTEGEWKLAAYQNSPRDPA